MQDFNDYSSCSFSGATQLASAQPNDGVHVTLSTAGERYFACSKICASNGHKVKICVREAGDLSSCCGDAETSEEATRWRDSTSAAYPNSLSIATIGIQAVLALAYSTLFS
jgi:hypothetical protein